MKTILSEASYKTFFFKTTHIENIIFANLILFVYLMYVFFLGSVRFN